MYIFCHYSCLGPCIQSTKVHPDNFLTNTQKEKEEILLEGIEDDIKEEEKVQSIPAVAPDPDQTPKTEPEQEIKKKVNPLMANGNKWEKPMSHFKAMSLIGKLFMTGKMRKMMANKWGGTDEPSTSTSSGSYSSGSTSETGSSSSELDSDANDDKAHRDKDTKVNKHDLALVRPRVIFWRNLVESRKAATFRMKYDLIKVRPKAMLWKYNSAKTNKTAKLKLKIVFYRVQSKAIQWRNFATMNRTTHAATVKLRMTFFRIRPKAMHWMNIALNTIAPLTTDHYTKFKLKMVFFKVRPKAMHWMNRPPSITAESIFKLKLAFFSLRPKAMHWMFMALTSTDTTMFMIRKAVFRVRPKAMHWMNSSQVQKGFQLKVAFYRIRPKAMCWMAQALFKNPMFQMNNEKNGNGEGGGDETDAEAPEIKNEVAEFRDKNEEAEFKEVVDIDISDPFVEQAAIKMQACYRGIRARQQMFLKRMEIEKEEMRKELEDSATLIQATFRGKLARREIKVIKVKKDTEKKEGDDVLNIDLNDPSVANAATKIQASFRGIQARKDIKVMKVNKEVKKTSITKEEVNKAEEEIDDIDPNDPDANNAAIKIQSGFRGSKARKEVQEMKDRMEEEQAATKIQAGFRGIQARKEVQEKKDKLELDKFEQFEQEKAATKIQAGFRGNKARKDVKVIKVKAEAANKEDITDIDLDDEELADAATKIQASFRGSQARKEVKVIKVKTANKEVTDGGGQSIDKELNQQKEPNEVEENNENDDDDELLEEFTDTSISTSEVSANAPIRNKKHAYKLVKTLVISAGEEEDAAAKIQAGFRGIRARREVQEKKDRIEQEQAATKIQAGFRGNKARKDVKVIKVKAEAANKEDITDIDLDDEDLAEAATKIQASFRGSQARKEVKVIKVKSANKDATNDEANVKEPKEDEKDQNDTNENEEDDLLDEFTDTSISTSEVSANAPIRNKKHAYKLVKSLLTSNKIEPAIEVVPPPPKSRLEMRLEQDAKRVDIFRPVSNHFRALALLGKMFMAKGKEELKKEKESSEESECSESENSHSSRSDGESSQESGYQTHRSKIKSSDLDKIRPRAIYWKNLVMMKKNESVPPPDPVPKPPEKTTRNEKLMTKWNKPISHFKALNLINQLFLSGQMRQMMSDKWGKNKNQETDTESGTETGSETGSSEESDSEGESETGSGSSGSAPSSKKGVTAMFKQMGSMLDSETAATRIQAGYRGHMARKEVVVIKQNAAAVRIQAGFRGLKARNRVKEMKAIEEKEE